MKQFFDTSLRLILLLVILSLPLSSFASGISVRPFLIDETIAPRGDSQNLITIKNNYDYRKVVIYATVNEITVDNEGEIKQFVSPVMTDRTNTITSWIEITRGRIEIPALESREVPLAIKVHPFAEPGEYHVFIGFVESSNRPKAEAVAMAGGADGVIVKVTVEDKREDSMHISSFIIDRFVFGDDKKKINIEVENTGDIASVPQGEIIFYDSRGVEVSSIPVKGESVAPGERVTLSSIIPIGNELGRYKANLSLKYGENQTAALYDTTFFYLMPLHLMLIIFGIVLAFSLFIVLLFRKSFVVHDDEDSFDEVTMYVRDGHEPNPQDHDIDLKNK